MDKAEERKFKLWWKDAKRSLYCSHDLGNEDMIARVAYSKGIKDKELYAQQVSREVAIKQKAECIRYYIWMFGEGLKADTLKNIELVTDQNQQ